MNTIIIYYSISGQTKLIADIMCNKLKCKQFEIETDKKANADVVSMYVYGAKEMISRNSSKLVTPKIDLSEYDNIIIGFPNWVSNFPPAVKEFVNNNDFSGKNIYLYITYAARGGEACLNNAAKHFTSAKSIKKLGKFSLPKIHNIDKVDDKVSEILESEKLI